VTPYGIFHHQATGWLIVVLIFTGTLLLVVAFLFYSVPHALGALALVSLAMLLTHRVWMGRERRSYEVSREGVAIRLVLGRRLVSLEQIRGVRLMQGDQLKWPHILKLRHLPLMRVGEFSVKPLGKVEACGGTQDDYVVIERRGAIPLVITPETPEEFVERLEGMLDRRGAPAGDCCH
jgi:hypothetical protein